MTWTSWFPGGTKQPPQGKPYEANPVQPPQAEQYAVRFRQMFESRLEILPHEFNLGDGPKSVGDPFLISQPFEDAQPLLVQLERNVHLALVPHG